MIKSVDNYRDMIRFRHFIVPRYEKIDVEILYSIVKHKLHLFHNFIAKIRKINGGIAG